MAAEAVREVEISYLRDGTQKRVLIEDIHFVIARPGVLQLNRGEGGDTRGKARPDHLIKERVVDLKRTDGAARLFLRRAAAEKKSTFGAEVDAARIDDEGASGRRILAIEDEDAMLLRMDRQIDAGHRRHGARPWPRGVDRIRASDACAIRKPQRLDPAA